jgi:phospholipase C
MDDVYGGEKLIKTVYEAIRNSPQWDSSLLIIIYDEHGGFYDSVAPGTAPAPNDTNDNSPNKLNEYGFDFKQYGVRVPAVIVSPLIAKGMVDHTVYDHSSVLATVERLFSLQPLTQRDAKANDLRHLFSLFTPRTDCPTQLNNPVPPVTTPASPTNKNLVENGALPQSGNVQGFLHIMLKTEFELSSRNQTDKDNILTNFRNIKTKEDANAYIHSIMKKVNDVKVNRK